MFNTKKKLNDLFEQVRGLENKIYQHYHMITDRIIEIKERLGKAEKDVELLLKLKNRVNDRYAKTQNKLARVTNAVSDTINRLVSVETKLLLVESKQKMTDESAYKAIRNAVSATHFHYAEGLEVDVTYWLKIKKPKFAHFDGRDLMITPQTFADAKAVEGHESPVQGKWDGITFVKPDGGLVYHEQVEEVIGAVEIPEL